MNDLYSRRLLGAATGLHPDAELACAAIKMAVAARGGVDAVNGPNWRNDESQRVVFHTVRGSTYTATRTHSCADNSGPVSRGAGPDRAWQDDVVAAAMIDRLVHHAEVLALSGESYRTRARRELLTKDRDK